MVIWGLPTIILAKGFGFLLGGRLCDPNLGEGENHSRYINRKLLFTEFIYILKIRDQQLQYKELSKNTNDYKKLIQSDLNLFLDRVQLDNLQKIKTQLLSSLSDSKEAIHVINSLIKKTEDKQVEEEINLAPQGTSIMT